MQGNIVLYFPNGSSIWYGRTTPSDVGLIVRRLVPPSPSSLFERLSSLTLGDALLLARPQVDRTIMEGKVVPELLRGGLGLEGKDGAKGVLDW